MNKVFQAIMEHKIVVIVMFALATVICGLLSLEVDINYVFTDYLPDSAPSTVAMRVMEEEYPSDTPNGRVMITPVTVPEALAIKERLQRIDGITAVFWLDDVADVYTPLATIDDEVLDDYYQDGHALFQLTVDRDQKIAALAAVRQVAAAFDKESSLAGSVVDVAFATSTTEREVTIIMLLVIPLCFLILLLTTGSWFEPVLFMIAIGVAIVLNRGTNLIFGEISFVTNAASSLLQLAVSMDYSIFLLHRFAANRRAGLPIQEAMIQGLKKAFSTVSASGVTTVIGFSALILMEFKIGPDMGWVMAKGILLSMISVLVLLPVLAVTCYKLIDKTQHRPLLPSFDGFARFVSKVRIPALVLLALVLAPCLMAQRYSDFDYGAANIFGPGTEPYGERVAVEEIFGKTSQMVLLVPRGDFAAEKALNDDLAALPRVKQVLSYVGTVGAEIPLSYLPTATREQFFSDHYSRLVLAVTAADDAFRLVDDVKEIAAVHYGDRYLLAGDDVSSYDMQAVVTKDLVRVNVIAVVAIFIVLLLTFRSLTLPFILVLVIEAAVWINLALPYFSGQPIYYIAYLIVSSVQLGATVDYAILMANRYLDERALYDRTQATLSTLANTSLSILTSAAILTCGGLLLGLICTNGVISQLGVLVGRGAVLSAFSVLFVLPALLHAGDRLIQKTTRRRRSQQ